MHSATEKPRPSKENLKLSKKQQWGGTRKGFFIAAGGSFVLLQLLFLMVMSLIYGSQFENSQKVHNLNVLAVDYDGSFVGEALNKAYGQVQGKNFPTITFESPTTYPNVQSIEEIVGDGKYWAAVYTWPGASTKLSAALKGGENATTFNPKEMISFVWLEGRYPTTSEGVIQSSLNGLISASSMALKKMTGVQALRALNQTDSAAIQAYLNPIVASNINLKPMHQGTRVLYNTATVALSIVQMFFFILALNGISSTLNLLGKLTTMTNIVIRQGLAIGYTLIASLLEITAIWAFKEDWQPPSYTFALLWMLTWLHMWVNFSVIDCAASFIPMQGLPFLAITYILLNVTSSLICIPLAPTFYRYAYAMPSHNWYEIFITISTGGCVNTIYRCLPILFAWFIVGQIGGTIGMIHKCRSAQAAAAQEEQKTAQAVKTTDLEDLSSST